MSGIRGDVDEQPANSRAGKLSVLSRHKSNGFDSQSNTIAMAMKIMRT